MFYGEEALIVGYYFNSYFCTDSLMRGYLITFPMAPLFVTNGDF